MMKQKIRIEQKNGVVYLYRHNGLEYDMDFSWSAAGTVKAIKNDNLDEIALANFVAELLCDALNAKSVNAELHDCNGMRQYSNETYLGGIDRYITNYKGKILATADNVLEGLYCELERVSMRLSSIQGKEEEKIKQISKPETYDEYVNSDYREEEIAIALLKETTEKIDKLIKCIENSI